MKRIYFKENIKLSIINKKSKYKILEKNNNRYIVGNSVVFEICGNFKTQFRQLIIIKGNAIGFLNYLIKKDNNIRFIFEEDREKYIMNNILIQEGFEKDVYDEFDDAFYDFLDLNEKLNKYNSEYSNIIDKNMFNNIF